jgi:hypothetical protein
VLKLIGVLLRLWLAVSLFGLLLDGLLWLAVVGLALFLVTLMWGGFHRRRASSRQPQDRLAGEVSHEPDRPGRVGLEP